MTRTTRGLCVREIGISGFAGSIWRFLRTLLTNVLYWQELEQQRRALLDMDDRMLKDIGLSRAEAHRLAARIPRDELGHLIASFGGDQTSQRMRGTVER